MSLSEYTIPIDGTMRFRHDDTQARFTVKTGKRVLQDDLMHITLLGGAMTTAGFMYNALTMSGGVSWWDPATGKPITRPKVQMRVRAQDILRDDEECGCAKCEKARATTAVAS